MDLHTIIRCDKNVKKIMRSVPIIALILLVVVASCGNNNSNSANSNSQNVASATSEASKKKIICTIFPIYDWVREMVGENASNFEITCLINNGVDLHNFNPSASDIIDIQNCDMFIHVGGESDAWVNDVFNKVVKKDITKLNLLELMGNRAKVEELKEGMEGEHEEELDEHVWLSLKNAKYLCNLIKDNIIKLDNKNSVIYEENFNKYSKVLDELDNKYSKAADIDGVKVMLFGDRFPFRYLLDDYKIDYYAAFSGCSAESEASFKTIMFLASKVDELHLKHVLKIEGGNDKIAKTIIENTKTKDQDIITMNSMQAVTLNEIKDGATYISMMESNLAAFEKALR